MKTINAKDIPKERLGTTDENGWRVYIFPASVQGFFRKWRNVTQAILVLLFLIAPWIKIGGVQSILLDIPRRQFAFFGFTFWAHDTPILFFVIFIACLSLAFVTAIWGRVWCGWACPQTVFIDGVFRRIETWVVGNHLKQIKLAKAPWSKEKLIKYSIKWFLFLTAGLIISHSFMAYFVGSDRLWPMITSSPQDNWLAFVFMFSFTAILIFDFAWFREQFCFIMCPYGRIQSLLMDDTSLAVIYDEKRGEPRRQKSVTKEEQGDCVSCGRCIAVCPTGIDIRRGVQMECIACTACIDACDEIMEKVNKPKGLIRYDSVVGMQGKKKSIFSLRLYVYITFLAVSIFGLIYAVASKNSIDITILRGNDKPFEKLANTDFYTNHYKLVVKNRTFSEQEVSYQLDVAEKEAKLIAPMNPLNLAAGEQKRVSFFIQFKKGLTQGKGSVLLPMIMIFTGSSDVEKSIFKEVSVVGPHK